MTSPRVSPRRGPAALVSRAVHRHGLESLESRRLMACTVIAHGSSLWITGDDKPNQIVVTVDRSGATAVCDGVTKRFSFGASQPGTVAKVSLSDFHFVARGGNDHVSLRASADYFLKLSCAIDGGAGDDTLSADCVLAAPTVDGIKGECVIKGGSGDDTIDASMRCATGKHIAKATLFVDGGDGDDSITTRASTDEAAPPSSSSVSWSVSSSVYGGRGDDSIDVGSSFERTSLVPVAGSCVVDGGAGNDIEISSFSWGASNSASLGTGGASSGRFSHKMSSVVRGSSGDDVIDATCVCVDGGDKPSSPDGPATTFVGTCDGGTGDDSVSVDVQLPPVEPNAALSLNFTKITYKVSGGAGDDALYAIVSPRDSASGQASGRRIVTQCVVDGGSGFDSAVVSGQAVVVSSTVEEVFDVDDDGGTEGVDDWLD